MCGNACFFMILYEHSNSVIRLHCSVLYCYCPTGTHETHLLEDACVFQHFVCIYITVQSLHTLYMGVHVTHLQTSLL